MMPTLGVVPEKNIRLSDETVVKVVIGNSPVRYLSALSTILCAGLYSGLKLAHVLKLLVLVFAL